MSKRVYRTLDIGHVEIKKIIDGRDRLDVVVVGGISNPIDEVGYMAYRRAGNL